MLADLSTTFHRPLAQLYSVSNVVTDLGSVRKFVRGQVDLAEGAFAYEAAELVVPDGAEVRGRELAGRAGQHQQRAEKGRSVGSLLQELIVGVRELFGTSQRSKRRSWAALSARTERLERTLVLWACSSAWFRTLMGGISRDAARWRGPWRAAACRP